MNKKSPFKRISTLALCKRKISLLKRLRIPSHLVRASLVEQYLKCGKPSCRCAQGQKHGPFYYLTRCRGVGLVQRFLLKSAEQQNEARRGIKAYNEFQTLLEELYQINSELLRRAEPLHSTAR